MNVLLTSAGRRTSLIQAFQSAAHPRNGRVWAGDADPLAPALQVADEGLVFPRIEAPDYRSTIIEHVDTHDIDLVVPTIDPGLLPLAMARDAVQEAGGQVLTSTCSLLRLTSDKWETLEHFSEQGIRTPASWRPKQSNFKDWPDPVFVKPRMGSASENARRVAREDVPRILSTLDTPLLQEVIDAPEITVDALFNFDGRLLHYVPRLRIRTRNGESIQGRTLPDAEWRAWLRPLLHELGRLGARGPVTLQAFCTDPEPTLSEINPRFGGGFPLARAAGGHYPDWILQLCQGRSVKPKLGQYEEGLCMTRAHTEWFTKDTALESEP